jgi:hypothetical protein
VFPEARPDVKFNWELPTGVQIVSSSPASRGAANANQNYAKTATLIVSKPGTYVISGEVSLEEPGAKYASKRTFYIFADENGIVIKDNPYGVGLLEGGTKTFGGGDRIDSGGYFGVDADRTVPPKPEFEIQNGGNGLNASTTITGTFRYRNNANGLTGAYGTIVEAWDRNSFGDSKRGTGICDGAGNFSVTFDNAESGFLEFGTADIYLVFRSENGITNVKDFGGGSYAASSGVGNDWYYQDIPGGTVNSGSRYVDWGTGGISDNGERAFELCDYMSTVWSFCTNQGYEAHFTSLEWRLGKNDVWPNYQPSANNISIPDNNYSSYFVIYHEYGHSHMDSIYGEEMIPNSGGSHSIEGHYTEGLALSEGYASYVGQGASNQSRYLDFNPSNYIDWDAEPNRDGYGIANSNTDNLGYGYDSEGPVQSFFLDLWDSANAPTDPYDRIDINHSQIMEIMKNHQPSGHDCWSIRDFINGWQARGYDQLPKMWGQCMVHGMTQDRILKPAVGMESNGAYSGTWYWNGYASGWMTLRNYGSQPYNSWTSGQWVWVRFGSTDHTGYSQLGNSGTTAALAADDTRYLYYNTDHLFPNSRYIGSYNVGYGAYFGGSGWQWFYPASSGGDQFLYKNVVADTTAPDYCNVTDDGVRQGRNDRLHFTITGDDYDTGLAGIWYAVGTSAGATNTVGWTWVPNMYATTLDRTLTGLNLSYGTTYYVTGVAQNVEGVQRYAYSDGIKIEDLTAPVNVSVADDGLTTTNLSQLHFNIHGEEPDGRIAGYWYRIYNQSNVEIVPWQWYPAPDTTDVSITHTGLSLVNGSTYYVQVTCRNMQGTDTFATSNGIQAAQGRTVNGRINVTDLSGSAPSLAGRGAYVWVCSAPGSYDEYHYVTLDSVGRFSFVSAQFGSKRVVATIATPNRHWLWKAQNTTISPATGGTVPTMTLINGDSDYDNEVTIIDYINLSSAFGTTPSMAGWNAMVDFDEDGEITILDYLILSGNYEIAGDI